MNEDTVIRDAGGPVDDIPLLLDKHDTLTAEGIAVERLFIGTTTSPALPDAVESWAPDAGALPCQSDHEWHKPEVPRCQDAAEAPRRLSAL